jgi:hypothetical protein
VAEGVAHAPDASFTAANSRVDCDTGGKERRSLRRSEIAHCQEHRRIDAPPDQIDPAARWMASSASKRGNTAPESVFPLFFFARALSDGIQDGETSLQEVHHRSFATVLVEAVNLITIEL